MAAPRVTYRNPWAWVSTVYLAEGLPYVVVMTVAVILYKDLGISNTDITLYTSWLYLPWVIKPLWSPLVDILKTRRTWIWAMQLVLGASLACIALTLPMPRAFQYSFALFFLMAFSSATHDIAIDGFYLLATTEKEQSFFVGIRTTFYRIAMISGQGLLVILAGTIQDHTGLPKATLHVAAQPRAALVQTVIPESFPSTPLAGKLRVLVEPRQAEYLKEYAVKMAFEINPTPRSKAEVKPLIALAKSNNIAHGFYAAEKAAEKKAEADVPESWLHRFLRNHFGREAAAKSDVAGNIGIVTLHLSRPPGHDVVVTLGSKVSFGLGANDDKLFSLAEGSRFVFNDTNWNQPALAVIQLDPKLKTSAEAVMEVRSGNIPLAWAITFGVLAALFVVFAIYHAFILPYPLSDKPGDSHSIPTFIKEFFLTFGSYFRKQKIFFLLLFLLFYRFAESQLVKMVPPFLLDGREKGGLGLTTGQVGFVYGTIGIAALTFGGLLGGMVAARKGLKFWLWWMVLAIHLPDAVFVFLSYAQPDNFWVINLCVAIEQFGYGFGFTAYMLYMIYISRGNHPTAHYAICTGFMALGMMLPGFFTGWLQDIIGYQHFFVWVLLATIPGFLVVTLIPLDAEFGKKTTN